MSETMDAKWGHSLVALTPEKPVAFSPEEEARIAGIAKEIRNSDTKLAADFKRYGSLSPKHFPTQEPQRLLVDDFTPIAHLQHVLGLQYYTGRAFVRAGHQDIVLGTFAPIEGYIDYMDQRLGLGQSQYLAATPHPSALPYAVCETFREQPEAMARLCKALETEQGDLWFHPYMGHHCAWSFAERLQQNLKRKLFVAAPLPEICERANNKVWFTQVVKQTLGKEAALPGVGCRSAAEAAQALQDAAEGWSHVAIKLADSASGMGTEIYTQDDILSRSVEQLEKTIQEWLDDKDWNEQRSLPVLVEPWIRETLGSPSVQLWLPPVELGPPMVEGIYDQLFYPNNPHVFLGSIPSQLPQPWIQTLTESGAKLGRLFQHLGYVGRCSFDTLLSGADLAQGTLHYVECNGRWGGTSTPMTLMNRIFGDYRSQPYVAKDFHHERLKGVSFAEFVSLLDEILWSHKTKKGWGIVYNVGCLKPSGKLDIITLGDTFEQAQQRQVEFSQIMEQKLSKLHTNKET